MNNKMTFQELSDLHDFQRNQRYILRTKDKVKYLNYTCTICGITGQVVLGEKTNLPTGEVRFEKRTNMTKVNYCKGNIRAALKKKEEVKKPIFKKQRFVFLGSHRAETMGMKKGKRYRTCAPPAGAKENRIYTSFRDNIVSLKKKEYKLV